MDNHNNNLVKILYIIPDGEDGAGERESLWAHSLGEQRYELQNIPLCAEHLNVEDIVRCDEPLNEMPIIRELAKRSGNRTLRVIFQPEAPDEVCVDTMWDLRQRGIISEKAADKHFMFNVPSTSDYDWARDYLNAKEQEDVLWLYVQADED